MCPTPAEIRGTEGSPPAKPFAGSPLPHGRLRDTSPPPGLGLREKLGKQCGIRAERSGQYGSDSLLISFRRSPLLNFFTTEAGRRGRKGGGARARPERAARRGRSVDPADMAVKKSIYRGGRP